MYNEVGGVPRYHSDGVSRAIAVAEFEAHSLALLEEVAEKQEELVIMDGGKPLAKVVPITGGGR